MFIFQEEEIKLIIIENMLDIFGKFLLIDEKWVIYANGGVSIGSITVHIFM